MFQWWIDDGRLNERTNGSFFLLSLALWPQATTVHQSTRLHSSKGGRDMKGNRKGWREKQRERESGRKQSQRYCDTQRFLVSFWNLMNQTWCLHTHTPTHPHTHINPTLPVMTTWAYSCQNGLQRKAPKTSTYILSSFELGHPWSPVQTCQHVFPSQECQIFHKFHYEFPKLWKCSRYPCIRQKPLSTTLPLVCVLAWALNFQSPNSECCGIPWYFRQQHASNFAATVCREPFPVSACQCPRAPKPGSKIDGFPSLLRTMSGLHRALTPTSFNTFGMNWNAARSDHLTSVSLDLTNAPRTEWEQIPAASFQKLVESLPRRMEVD